ncbi:MAG: putative peptidase [bacterium ADurb.Bin431]|nr:MAG: putative peptidase [bacterium ADurb.Bin431]HOH06664.1 Xaa-Pro peptidase family protein [bacterium]
MVNEKIEQAIAIMKEQGVDLWLTFVRETTSSPDPVLDLLAGAHVVWPSAFVLTVSGKAVAIVGSLDMHGVRDAASRYDVKGYVDSVAGPLLELLEEEQPKRIAINYSANDVMADGLSHGLYLILVDYLKGSPWGERLESSEALVAALRGRKSPAELSRIKSAIRETLDIYDQVTAHVRAGMTEREVAAFITDLMEARGLTPAWSADHCPSVFTGPDTAGAHAGPTGRRIEPGHIMNTDFGVRYEGYVSDLQRTWYFLRPGESEAPAEVKRGFATIHGAIQAAAAALKPGVEGWTIDKVARQYIIDAGYDEFPHALGHQVGRSAHDGAGLLCPVWDRYKNLPFLKVEIGQVYTLEPRLTVPGHGVVTIEEMVVVTETGCEFLSEPQRDLLVV